jgi:NitT/TauT family transport system permease protein
MKALLRSAWPPVLTLCLLTLAFECIVRAGLAPEFLFPAPSTIATTLLDSAETLWQAFLSTALSACLGLALSFVVGTLVAILLATSEFMRRAFLPYAVFFQTVPVIALGGMDERRGRALRPMGIYGWAAIDAWLR